MTIGFIGTGTIAAAVIEGLAWHGQGVDIFVSPRSAEISTRLAATFPQVRRAASNAEVAVNSDIVCLAMLPTKLEEALEGIAFRADQTIVSFVAGVSLETLAGIAPGAKHCRVVPLPMIARREGPILCYPPLPEVVQLLDGLGTLVVPESEAELQALMAVSGFMSTYFELQGALGGWLESRGVAGERGSLFVRSLFAALGTTGLAATPDKVADLPREHETPGGMNFRTRTQLAEAGWFSAPGAAFEHVLALKRSALK